MTQILSEIKEIEILKKKLSRARLDMDSANTALKHKNKKVQEPDPQLIADAENATNQFHMAQDTYITALLSFTSKELDHIKPLQGLLNCHQRLYNDISKILNNKLPTIQDSIQKSANSPVFGTDLDKHLESTGKPIAAPLKKCCSSLLKSGIEQPGIFRLAGGLPQLRKLKAMFDSNRMEEEDWEQDVFTLAQAIKLYLRELPEPLLTYTMFEEWISCVGNPKVAQRLPRCKELIEKLPNSFQTNLQYLCWFLKQVAAMEPQNKMGSSNLGLVVGPNILRTKNEDDNESITALNAASALTEMMISNYDMLFPDPLPADVTRLSLPRANTVSGGSISSSRPSVRAHKKGKAPPTPKRPGPPGNAPAPPPRVDLNRNASAPGITTSPQASPVTHVKSPVKTNSSPVINPFGSSDEDELAPEPPKRSIDKDLNLNIEEPVRNPFDSPTPDGLDNDLNPFGPESVEEVSPLAEIAQADESNPFGESETDEVTEEDSEPVITEKRATPPPVLAVKPKLSTSSSLDERVNLDTSSPTFSNSGSNNSTPSHSRNPSASSNSNTPIDSVKQHHRSQSDGSNKPAPPPRPALDKVV